MGVHIDITGLRPERIAAVISPLAELGMALHALSEPAHHPGLQAWVTAVTARLEPHLADRMCEADFLWRTTFSDLFLACAGVPGRAALPGGTLAEELDLLDKLSDEQFVDGALELHLRAPLRRAGARPAGRRGAAPPLAGAGRRAGAAAAAVHRAAAGRPAAHQGVAAAVPPGLRGGVLR
ncbi:hypothetical protein SALBM217S_01065 [Streptomyces griseoloalbus]